MPKSRLHQRPRPGRPNPSRPNTVTTRFAAPKALSHIPTKRRGDLSEISFLHRASYEGLDVSRPYGDNNRYDSITDNGPQLHRIQVKSSGKEISPGRYHVNVGRRLPMGAVPYTKAEIDFLVIFLHRENAWYILPIEVVDGRVSLAVLAPQHPSTNAYTPYLEAWHLLTIPIPPKPCCKHNCKNPKFKPTRKK